MLMRTSTSFKITPPPKKPNSLNQINRPFKQIKNYIPMPIHFKYIRTRLLVLKAPQLNLHENLAYLTTKAYFKPTCKIINLNEYVIQIIYFDASSLALNTEHLQVQFRYSLVDTNDFTM